MSRAADEALYRHGRALLGGSAFAPPGEADPFFAHARALFGRQRRRATRQPAVRVQTATPRPVPPKAAQPVAPSARTALRLEEVLRFYQEALSTAPAGERRKAFVERARLAPNAVRGLVDDTLLCVRAADARADGAGETWYLIPNPDAAELAAAEFGFLFDGMMNGYVGDYALECPARVPSDLLDQVALDRTFAGTLGPEGKGRARHRTPAGGH